MVPDEGQKVGMEPPFTQPSFWDFEGLIEVGAAKVLRWV